MRYLFDWDPRKAQSNRRKHGVTFERATEIFRDPFALSLFDAAHSDAEERWITLGKDSHDVLLVLVHTFGMVEDDDTQAAIRIISARRATRGESAQYERQEEK